MLIKGRQNHRNRLFVGVGFLVAANVIYHTWTLSTIQRGEREHLSDSDEHGSVLQSPNANRPAFLPGIYRYGSHNRGLVITGASITSNYDSRETLWYQFFALGDRCFGDPIGAPLEMPCRQNFTDENLHMVTWETGELGSENFVCGIANRTAKLELMPSESYDVNTVRVIQVWRCPLHSIMSKYDVQRFLNHVRGEKMLEVDLLYNESDHLSSVTKMHIVNTAPIIGVEQLRFPNANAPLSSTRRNITLCTAVEPNSLIHLGQFIRYHRDVIGIDHIYLGLDTQHEVWEKDDVILQAASSLLRPEITKGTISISTIWDHKNLGYCMNREILKMHHYVTCLYHAKSISEFVATWDIDEFFVFTGNREKRLLPDFLRKLNHSACEDWSFITMRSSTAGGSLPAAPTGLVGLDFPIRENSTNEVWQKSISKTKSIFLNGFHIPGSSLPQGKTNVMTDSLPLFPNGECAFYTDEAIMVHVRGIMDEGARSQVDEPSVLNELASLLAFDSSS
ncbi:hypothetical protein ACHAWX_000608 [Stephanocyclus meneghinianus]